MWNVILVTKATALILFAFLYVIHSGYQNTNHGASTEKSKLKDKLPRECPCADQTLCERVTTIPPKEVFTFSVNNKNYAKYDWQKITTVVEFGYHDDDLMCLAHSNNARVVTIANYPADQLTNTTARGLWVSDVISEIRDNFLDGVNVDFESEVTDAESRVGLTSLMREPTSQVKGKWPSAQVSFDVAWSPDCIDRRCYDYRAIADIVDLVFVMSYDERSQIYGRCEAWANSAINNTQHGIQGYLSVGILPHKLVLGVPWYGYKYPCLNYDQKTFDCDIIPRPFKGVNCSDAAGREIPYSEIVGHYLALSSTGKQWDRAAQSPFFVVQSEHDVTQIWYDDPTSLKLKLELVQRFGLGGAGMWNADSLNYSNPEQIQSMWELL